MSKRGEQMKTVNGKDYAVISESNRERIEGAAKMGREWCAEMGRRAMANATQAARAVEAMGWEYKAAELRTAWWMAQ